MENKTPAKQPLVSIVIPVYNGADYMREAIDSALGQSYSDVEVIVVNDGSTDQGATREIALSYGDRIRYIEKENGGVSSALNAGIREMKGSYFSWLSHDDSYGPDKIKHQIETLLEVGGDNCIAMCRADYINASSEVIRASVNHGYLDKRIYSWQESLLMLFQHTFIGCNLLIPREAFDRCGFFDESLRYVQDILMWTRIFAGGYDMVVRLQVDVHNRIHDKQLTQTGRDLFDAESLAMSQMILPEFLKLSTKEYNFVYEYAHYNATYHHSEIVKNCIRGARERNLFSAGQTLKLRMRLMYGGIRPAIRKVYYGVFHKVKTN